MNLGEIARRAGKLLSDNSPVILTGLAVAGVITTTVLTAKASFKAAELMRDQETVGGEQLAWSPKERIRLCWTLYIPAATTGTLTVLFIIGANRIGARRAAALAAAYTISEKAFEEYKDKIVEKFGERKEEAVRADIAQARIDNAPKLQNTVFVGAGSVLCFETYTGRYFASDMETLKRAQNDTNYQVLRESYASLSDFYDRIGLDHTDQSDDVGWNSDTLLELGFATALSPNGAPVLSIMYHVMPIRHYYRCN